MHQITIIIFCGGGMYTQQEVLDFIEEEDIKFVRLTFFDIFGTQKNISIIAREMPRAFKDGIAFDASAIAGFESAEKSDLFLHPDPSTLVIIPWRPSQSKVASMYCDITYPDGTPYQKDSRFILKKAIKLAKDANIDINIGAEMKFYLFKQDEAGLASKEPFDNAGYMDIAPVDRGENIRRDICFTLEQMGIVPEASHHEEGPGQNEIDFHYAPPLVTADNISAFKWVVRTKASVNGLVADFSPKPLEEKCGNGMHIILSCKELANANGTHLQNALPNRAMQKCAVASLLNHLPAMTLFLNPSQDSYKRLGEGKACKNVCWAKQSRTALIRIPASTPEHERIELRSPDNEANPYIALSLLIYASIEGILQNATLAQEATTKEEIAKAPKLPSSLQEACEYAKKSDFIQKYLDKTILDAYAEHVARITKLEEQEMRSMQIMSEMAEQVKARLRNRGL